MDTTIDDSEMNVKYDRIREVLQLNCSEDDFRLLQCPQCGGKLMLRVNYDGKRFFVWCIDDTTHLAMHGANEAPPLWFRQAPRVGWYE
jgi:hypothetical protein